MIKLKLVACVKFWSISSTYWWKNKIVNDQEIFLLIETKEKFYKKIEILIKKIHSYETPCIVSIKSNKVEKNYYKWLNNSIK